MADGTPDVQGPAKLPGNPDGIDLDAIRNGGATPSLAAFVAAYNEDDNIWWVLGCGHHQNLFEEAVDEVERLREKLAWADAYQASHERFRNEAYNAMAERDTALARIQAVEELADKMDDEMVRYESKHNPECQCDWIPATAEAVGRFREAVYPVAAPAAGSANPDCAPSGAESGSLPTARAAGGTSVVQPEDGGE